MVVVPEINKVYGARGAYIANTLIHDSDQLMFFCLWASVAAVILVGMKKVMRTALDSNQDTKTASKVIDMVIDEPVAATGANYSAMPAPKSLSQL